MRRKILASMTLPTALLGVLLLAACGASPSEGEGGGGGSDNANGGTSGRGNEGRGDDSGGAAGMDAAEGAAGTGDTGEPGAGMAGVSGGGEAGAGGGMAGAGGGIAGEGGGMAGAGGGVLPGNYGVITQIQFQTGFLFDYARLEANDQGYVLSHQAGIQLQAGFTGTYGPDNVAFPPTATQTMVLGTHMAASGGYPASVSVMQNSIAGQSLANPVLQLDFVTDVLQSGPFTVGLADSDLVQLLVSEVEGQTQCVAAIGVGELEVTEATNTSATEGGTLALRGSNIALYHPTETPYGDVTQQSNIAVCPRR